MLQGIHGGGHFAVDMIPQRGGREERLCGGKEEKILWKRRLDYGEHKSTRVKKRREQTMQVDGENPGQVLEQVELPLSMSMIEFSTG